jgi:hypothetical protein
MIREMGAVLQVIRQGTGSSEMAATAFEALIRTLMDAKKAKVLESGGIKIFDPEALKQGEEVMRPLNEIMTEIVKKSNGRSSILSQIFDAEAMRAFNAVSGEFKRNGNIDSLERFMKVQADGVATLEDSARAAKDAAAGLTSLVTSLQLFADGELAKTFLQFANALNGLDNKTVDRAIKIGGALAVGGGSLWLGNKIFKGGSGLYRLLRPGSGRGISGLPGGDNVVPVYVVNDGFSGRTPLGSGRRGLGTRTPGNTTANTITKASPWLAGLQGGGLAMLPAGIAGVVAVGSRKGMESFALWDVARSSNSRLQQLRQQHMVMGGGADTYQVQAIDAELARRGIKGELKITITPEGTVKVDKLTSSPNFDIDVDAGQMMRSH